MGAKRKKKMIIQIIGLPGSGKTFLAKVLSQRINAIHLNADDVRADLNKDLGFGPEARIEQARRMGALARLINNQGWNVVVDFICPTEETREAFGQSDYLIVMDRTPTRDFPDTTKMWQAPQKFNIKFNDDLELEDKILYVIKDAGLHDWSAPTTLMLGRYQPWHEGHHALYEEAGKRTNFQYIMFINTLAGRSYNDLMQYPIFPWILADYDSEELDLNNPSTFRDLSKPMGAQTPDRMKQFKKRFQEWDDPSGETPPYHYGTHYSSAMIVASYLVRLEPFTQIFLRLQGGHFDLADRMFHSIKDNWLSASKNNMADVKELIPEFFYLTDFMKNSNKFDLGRKQSGVVLNDVVLPTWAKDDPREFIRVHRMALESDFVSAHLNEWIDLIFGFKQLGAAAVDAVNVFHHLFYEGAVDIDDINDPLKRNAIIGFINNFGQIPKQLFKKPHPSKKLNSQLIYGIPDRQYMFFHYLNCLKPSLQPIKELKSQVGQIISTDKGILAVEQNKFLMPPTYQRYISWGFADESVRIGYTDYEKSFVSFENVQDGSIFCCCSPDSKIVITGGTSTVVNVWELGKSKLRKLHLKARLYGHTDTVTCMSVSNAYHMLVSGSRDRSCIVWDINRCKFVRQLPNHYSAVSAICINELTGDIASASGTFLYLWNINGELLASVNTIALSRNQVILTICMSQINEWDKNNVILTGGTDGVVRMWSLDYRQEPIDSPQIVESQKIGENTLLNCNMNMIALDQKTRSNSSDCESDTEFSAPDYLQNSGKKEQSPKQDQLNESSVFSRKEVDEEYIVVNKMETDERTKLKTGHKWVRHFTFRSKLTMHTSFDRKDNSQPASVSAISISK